MKSQTCVYYKTCFPFKVLQDLVLGTPENSPFELRAHYWPGWDIAKLCFKKEPVFSPRLIEKLCLDWEPQNQFVALHWTSPTEKLFVVDADLDPETDQVYAECLKTHQNPDQKLCKNCWKHLLSVGKKLEEKFRDLHESGKFFPGHGGCAAVKKNWKPMLWCFSGNRGLHLYVHPSLNYQFLGMDARRTIAQLLKEAYPIDVEASAQTEGHMIRLWFSPHQKTHWCCTPFSVSETQNFEDFVVFWRRADDTVLLDQDLQEMKKRADLSLSILTNWLHL